MTTETHTFANMHEAGALMQERFPVARDLDFNGQHWVSTVIQDTAKSRDIFPLPVTVVISNYGWFTYIEITFTGGAQYRFVDSRDGFIEQKDYTRAVRHLERNVEGFHIMTALEKIKARKAANA
jgi:hypothetical protein